MSVVAKNLVNKMNEAGNAASGMAYALAMAELEKAQEFIEKMESCATDVLSALQADTDGSLAEAIRTEISGTEMERSIKESAAELRTGGTASILAELEGIPDMPAEVRAMMPSLASATEVMAKVSAILY